MTKRNNNRVKAVLPVSVHRPDTASSNGSRELAHTVDVSLYGARLGGIRAQFEPGEVVEVQYRRTRARFRVVWSRAVGKSEEWQIGLECLDSQKEIWGLSFTGGPQECQSLAQASEASGKRRAHARYRVQGGADVRRVNGAVGQWTQVGILSMGGCFCRTTAPLPVLTRVRIFLRFEGTEFEAYGVVRSSVPYRGMGIEFTGFVSSVESQRLKWFIASLQEVPVESTAPGALSHKRDA